MIRFMHHQCFRNDSEETHIVSESDDQFIIAVNFKSDSHVGQIYRVRFLQPNGSVEAQLYVGLSEGFLIIDLLNSENRQILIKPLENVPISESPTLSEKSFPF